MGVPCLGLGRYGLICGIIPSQEGVECSPHQFGHRDPFLLRPMSQAFILFLGQIDIHAFHLLPLVTAIIMMYNEYRRTRVERQEEPTSCSPLSTRSMARRNNTLQSMKPYVLSNSSATSDFVFGWMSVASPRTILSATVLPLPKRIPLPLVSTPRLVKPRRIGPGHRFPSSMTIAKRRSQGRKAIPAFSMTIAASSTSRRDGSLSRMASTSSSL